MQYTHQPEKEYYGETEQDGSHANAKARCNNVSAPNVVAADPVPLQHSGQYFCSEIK
jgi:hypothetical protein